MEDEAGGSPDPQPVGPPVPGWTPRRPVRPARLTGPRVLLEAFDLRPHSVHLRELVAATGARGQDQLWTYLGVDRCATPDALAAMFAGLADDRTLWPMAIRPVGQDGNPEAVAGTASYLRVGTVHGTAEVGAILYGPGLRRSAAATEAMALMARYVFAELGYRRHEWKCDALNAPSRAAARRLGFTEEGVFRQAVVVKGRNRDTAWFAMTDADWTRLSPAYDAWLDPKNFDERGRQRQALSTLTSNALCD